ncbi:MAG: hypothetical protein AB1806_18185 [Acidobacteriota bacterium]
MSALHAAYFRNFESAVAALADRGHDIALLVDEPEDLGGERLARDLQARHLQVRFEYAPSYGGEDWFPVARKLRQGLDYLRFLDPLYADYPKLRERAEERAPRGLARLLALPGARSRPSRALLARALGLVVDAMPVSRAMEAWLSRERPDALLLASVTNPRAPQLDHLRCARRLGIPTGVCVYSWDHLSSKTLIRETPDRVFVWNETQRREAVELHGLPPDRIVVTGAQVYDQWFNRQPTRAREQFCADLAIPPGEAILLYVCSAMTPDPGELRVVKDWIGALRRSHCQALRAASVLVRPHPERRAEWEAIDWSGDGIVRVTGRIPVDQSAKDDYFNALTHAAAVVGIVTSAFLEAAIAGKPVFTVTPPELRTHQMGMRHFRYLLEVEDGLLVAAPDWATHVRQLEELLARGDTGRERRERFLRAFVRPSGLDCPATPGFVDAVESLALQNGRIVESRAARWHTAVAGWVVRSGTSGLLRSALLDRRQAAEERAVRARLRHGRLADRQKKAERLRDHAERTAARDRARAARLVDLQRTRQQQVAAKQERKQARIAHKRARQRERRHQRIAYLYGRLSDRLQAILRGRS